MNQKIVVLLAAITSVTALPSRDHRNPNGRIIGGEEAVPHSVPWIVSIAQRGSRPLSGGTIISAEWIVTDAWFASNYPASLYDVVAAEHDVNLTVIEPEQQTRRVDRIILHSSYRPETFTHNIALMHLSVPFVFNNMVRPIEIAAPGMAIPPIVTLSGWGEAIPGSGYTSTLLHTVNVSLVPSDTCRDSYGSNNYPIGEDMFCAGDATHGWSTADWGGPLTGNVNGTNYLFGMPSHTLAQIPFDVYVNSSYFKEWVAEAMASDPVPGPECPPFNGSPQYIPGISCNTYYMCMEPGGFLQYCPRPLLWDQSRLTCADPSTVDCDLK